MAVDGELNASQLVLLCLRCPKHSVFSSKPMESGIDWYHRREYYSVLSKTKRFRGFKAHYRGIAQSGSALALGARCREFKSLYPDQFRWFTQRGSIVRIHAIP